MRRYHDRVKPVLATAPRRFEALDSLRGICAVLVVMFHMPVASHWRDWGLVQHGYLFVDYFFVLSGFVIAHAYAGRLTTPREAGRFMVRRLGRVWPLHALMLAAFIGLELARLFFQIDGATPFVRDRSVEAIFANLLLVQAWHVLPSLTWNGPAWTLSAEVACYLIFAGLVLVAPRRFRWIGAVLALIGAVLVLAYARRWMNTTYDFAVPRAVYGFFLGCLLQGVWTRIPRLGGSAATALEVAAVVAICVFIGWATGPVTVAVTLIFVAVVWVFAGEEGALSRVLDHPALVTLGRWSFAIYMVHMFVLTVLMIVARKLDWVPGGRRIDFGSVWINDLFAVALFGLILVLALVAHRLVETPAQRLIDRWTARPKVAH
ncbi:acyltransferase 3 [Brevundimonas subvibrioides ATCC 15264]|uniref:Acyltransferase 3 n=1 Tax=Brevundimonas subvibrioides (strain ATCC 15264 / DSM 4735 / LMG 14903 / NBRC 16000 / CB 81) TaxID=633149 RepID=D9QH34_BRESC|nr:acyltransferase 3 [Brevundimonas subvibrioides ATCC 15264]